MESSNLVQPPSFSRLRSLVLRRWFELVLLMQGGFLTSLAVDWCLGFTIDDSFLSLLAPLERAIVLVSGPTCLLVAWGLRRSERRVSAGRLPHGSLIEPAVALLALPKCFSLAKISRLPLMMQLLRARLEFTPEALVIQWRFGERSIPYREISRADWQLDGVLLLFRDGKRLLLPTSRPPSFSGPSGHYPELRHEVQGATFAVLRHNQNIAERIQSETERAGGPSYRRAAPPSE